MIVAAGAGDGETLKCLPQRIDLVIDDIRAYLPETNTIVVAELAQPQEGRSDYRFIDAILDIDPRFLQQVSGEMLANQLVVRNILIEGADQVIAVEPRAFDFVVPVIAESFGEAHDVHPVAGPMLSEMGRRKQAVDQPFISA